MIGGAYETHIGFARIVGAKANQLACLQHAQQFGLHGQRHVANLIQKKRALVCVLKHALAVAVSACERAAHVAKQLIFQKCFTLTSRVECCEATVLAL
ncbi:MAG: hypothetical protein DWH76_00865 [Planctomycetota bacterium]|nr:MAG: hypothetical protein DWH76_00865 [Planctomycetota bacterium]